MQPAAIRYNNPGAQYPGPSSRRFGSTGFGIIGGGHKIAAFPSPVHGAAAQYDLLRRNYAGMPLGSLIHKWSGGNDSKGYTDFVSKRMGLTPNSVITGDMLRDPNFAVKLAQTKSQWETGGKFPLNDQQWRQAHGMAYGGVPAPGSFRAAQEASSSAGPMPQVAGYVTRNTDQGQDMAERKPPSLFGALANNFQSPAFMGGAVMFDSAARGGGIADGARMVQQGQQNQTDMEWREKQAAQQNLMQQQRMAMEERKLNASLMPQVPQMPWYVQQDGSLHPAMLAKQQAGRQQTNVVNNVGGDTNKFRDKYDEKIAGHYAELRIDGLKKGAEAKRQLNSLSIMEKAIDDPNFYSGTGGDTIQSLKKAAQTLFGLPVKGVAAAEVVSSLSKELALNEKSKLPGTLSNSDVALLLSLPAGLSKTPEGNRRLVQIGMLQKRYEIAMAQSQNDYAAKNNNRLDEGYSRYLSQIEDEYGMKFKTIIKELEGQQQSPAKSPMVGVPQLSFEDFQRAPSGTQFQAPDGTIRVKP